MRSIHKNKCPRGMIPAGPNDKCPDGKDGTKRDPRWDTEMDVACCDRSMELSTAPAPNGEQHFTVFLPDGTQMKVDVGFLVQDLKFRMLLQDKCPLRFKDEASGQTFNFTEHQIKQIDKAYKAYTGLDSGLCGAIQQCNREDEPSSKIRI